MKCLQCLLAGLHACVSFLCFYVSCFYTNLYISFIYEDIFTKVAKNVYSCENMSVKHFVIFLKTK